MRFRAGGVRFRVEPDARLSPAEREAIGRLEPEAADDPQEPVLIELTNRAPWTSDDPALFPQRDPAVLRWVGERLLGSHGSFVAEIDPFAARARLHRRDERAFPLEVVIRASMMARLPLLGGLPLHAAGVVMDGRGVVFFGPSGAGKTTVASTSPVPVLSDELVAVAPGRPFDLVRSGFWGEQGSGRRVEPAPLALLVDLARGPRLRFTALRPAVAAGRLLASVPVPRAPSLWSRVLAVGAELVRRVPVHRMEWALDEPPWEGLAALLDGLSPRT
ncbi:MAG TPA: hypothetical protein VMT70_02370 [Vicinamibacteria bacterium]|nr:hypothetical protein [Vicinamibacteria bacterium]